MEDTNYLALLVKVVVQEHVDARRNDCKGLKYSSKGKIIQKAADNNIAIEKLLYVNRKFAQALIRVSL
ncbi:1397_t:CDS:2, partial [Gigaspora margarita]